jgi:hypothetical protein
MESIKVILSSSDTDCVADTYPVYRSHAPMIAVGSDDTAVSTLGQVHVFEYSEGQRYINLV